MRILRLFVFLFFTQVTLLTSTQKTVEIRFRHFIYAQIIEDQRSAPSSRSEADYPRLQVKIYQRDFQSLPLTKISDQTISEKGYESPQQLFQNVPGLQIQSSSSQVTSFFLRGGDSSHLLLVQEGIPFYDAGTIQGTAFLNDVDYDELSEIEIYRGAQSVVYGGHAMNGVIKFKTKKNTQSPTLTRLKVLTNGDLFSIKLSTDIKTELSSGSSSSWRFSPSIKVSAGHYGSPAQESERQYKTQNLITQFKVYNDQHFFQFKYQQAKLDIPTVDFNTSLSIDADDYSGQSQLLGFQYQFMTDEQLELNLAYDKSQRVYFWEQSKDSLYFTGIDEKSNSDKGYISLEKAKRLISDLEIKLGLQSVYEKLKYTSNNNDVVSQSQYFLGAYGVLEKIHSVSSQSEWGARIESVDGKESTLVHHLGYKYKIWSLQWATGFKNPSLFQRYYYKNQQELKSEKISTYSITQKNILSDIILYSNSKGQKMGLLQDELTLFYSQYRDLIQAVGYYPQTSYQNVNQASAKGVELNLKYQGIQNIYEPTFIFNYTYQEPRDHQKNNWLNQRPLTFYSFNYEQALQQQRLFTVEWQFVGTRTAEYYTMQGLQRSELESYNLINFVLNQKINENRNLNFRLNNIFNKTYQSVYGYFIKGHEAQLSYQQIF